MAFSACFTHPNVKVHESTAAIAYLLQSRDAGVDEVLSDTKPVSEIG